MVLLHGWVNLREGNKQVQLILEELSADEGITISKAWMNGEVVYNLFICHNHYGGSFTKLFESLERIAELESPDSYGLVHLLNDEDPLFFDEWQVWRLSKNKFAKAEADKYLSPYSEKVAWYPEDDS